MSDNNNNIIPVTNHQPLLSIFRTQETQDSSALHSAEDIDLTADIDAALDILALAEARTLVVSYVRYSDCLLNNGTMLLKVVVPTR
jgi:hypothetical protein